MKPTDKVRVQKLVSNYSKYSRREFEKMIVNGDVRINGNLAKLGDHVTINDKIEAYGKPIKIKTKHDYYLVNKPKGYISNRTDKLGRPVISLIEGYEERNLFTVGRLDVNTTGLIIVTNDGDLSERVTSPKMGKRKEYLAWLKTPITNKEIAELSKGIVLDDGYKTKPLKKIKIVKTEKGPQLVKLVLTEGKKNQVKRMFIAVGSEVANLKRTTIEGLKLDGIPLGSYRKMKKTEIYGLLGLRV